MKNRKTLSCLGASSKRPLSEWNTIFLYVKLIPKWKGSDMSKSYFFSISLDLNCYIIFNGGKNTIQTRWNHGRRESIRIFIFCWCLKITSNCKFTFNPKYIHISFEVRAGAFARVSIESYFIFLTNKGCVNCQVWWYDLGGCAPSNKINEWIVCRRCFWFIFNLGNGASHSTDYEWISSKNDLSSRALSFVGNSIV